MQNKNDLLPRIFLRSLKRIDLLTSDVLCPILCNELVHVFSTSFWVWMKGFIMAWRLSGVGEATSMLGIWLADYWIWNRCKLSSWHSGKCLLTESLSYWLMIGGSVLDGGILLKLSRMPWFAMDWRLMEVGEAMDSFVWLNVLHLNRFHTMTKYSSLCCHLICIKIFFRAFLLHAESSRRLAQIHLWSFIIGNWNKKRCSKSFIAS